MLLFYIVTAVVFSSLGSLSAFLITYAEYLKHFPHKKRPLKMALETALATFAFFMFISLAIVFVGNLF